MFEFDVNTLVQVMLLDAETTPIVSLAFAQSALMRQVIQKLHHIGTESKRKKNNVFKL